jgi:transcriptional regulator GlxA family with amidase domain
MMTTRNIGIFIFPEAEVLDFAGPYEVFNVANTVSGENLFHVFLVAETKEIVYARNNFKVVPDEIFSDELNMDLMLIPGGIGRKVQMNNPKVLEWVKKHSLKSELVLSVCTGSFILGNAGLLKNLSATTHHGSYDEFEKLFPDTKLIRQVKYVDNGTIITAGGISAGIDMSLMVVGKLHGEQLAKNVARRMEYDWQEVKNDSLFH